MNIRNRTERGATSLPGVAAAAAIVVTAGVHAAWASGSTWPREHSNALADLVVGRRPFPSPAMCWSVTGLLGIAGAGVGASAVGRRGPGGLARLVAAATATVLLARGVGGVVTSAARLAETTEEFRRADLAVYSPLCIALSVGAFTAARAS